MCICRVIHLIVVVGGKNILRLLLSAQITGQGFIKGISNTDNYYNNLKSYELVNLAELELYGKVVNINKIFPPNDPYKKKSRPINVNIQQICNTYTKN